MSSRLKSSLIYLREYSQKQVTDLFSEAKRISEGISNPSTGLSKSGRTAALIFFEASTRTRLSFETACARLGLHPLVFSGKAGSSLEKGESPEDTVLNVAAMDPSLLIIRAGADFDMAGMSKKISIPILNAGWGVEGHPTQALLDAYTIWDKRSVEQKEPIKNLNNEKILIIGDVRHSRVAASHLELSKILNYEVAFCGPKEFLPESSDQKIFNELEQGLEWATVVMALRVQSERHSENHSQTNYFSLFGLNREKLKNLKKNVLVMHPGPVNHGVEMDLEAIQDPRSVILQQVTNGIYIRQALVHRALS